MWWVWARLCDFDSRDSIAVRILGAMRVVLTPLLGYGRRF